MLSSSTTSSSSPSTPHHSCSTCSVCFESFQNSCDGLKCANNSHFICTEDFNKYCSEIAFSKIFLLRSSHCKIVCPVPSCGEFFDSLQSFYSLNANEKKRYTNLLHETLLSTSGELSSILLNFTNVLKDSLTLSCPYCSIAIDPTPDACSAVMCLNCSSYYCNYCFQCFNSFNDSSKNRAEAHEHVATHQPESSSSESRDAFLSPDLVKIGQRNYQKTKIVQYIKSLLISNELIHWICNSIKSTPQVQTQTSSSSPSATSAQKISSTSTTSCNLTAPNNIVNNLKHIVQLILIMCYNDLILLNLDILELWNATMEQVGSLNLDLTKYNSQGEHKNPLHSINSSTQANHSINHFNNPYNVVMPVQGNSPFNSYNSQFVHLHKEWTNSNYPNINTNKVLNMYGQNVFLQGGYVNFNPTHNVNKFNEKVNLSNYFNKIPNGNMGSNLNPNLNSSINESNYIRKVMLMKKKKILMMIKSKNKKSNSKNGLMKSNITIKKSSQFSKDRMNEDEDGDDEEYEDYDDLEEDDEEEEDEDDGNMVLIGDEEEDDDDEDDEDDEDDDEDGIYDGNLPHTVLTNHSYNPIEDFSSYQEQFTAISASSTEDIDGEEDNNSQVIDDKISQYSISKNKIYQNYYINFAKANQGNNLAISNSQGRLIDDALGESYFYHNANSIINLASQAQVGNLYVQNPFYSNSFTNSNSVSNNALLNSFNLTQKIYNPVDLINSAGSDSNLYNNNYYLSMMPTLASSNTTQATSPNTSNRSGALLANAILANNMTAVDQILGAFGNNLDYDYVARSENHDLDIRVIFYPLTSLAILLGLESLAVHLIKLGANVLAVDSFKNRSVFYIAIEHGCTQVLQCIFEKFPNIDLNQPLTQEEVAYSALHIAARFNQGHLIEMLMRYGARHNVFEKKDGYCPLGLAVALNNTWVAIELIKFNAEVNWISDMTVSPFYVAIEKGQLNIVQFILEKYPNLVNSSIDTLGTKPIHLAVKFKHAHIVKYLIETCKSNCDLLDSDGLSPIMVAVQCNDIHSALLLLDYKVDLRNCTVDHRYCIHLVVERGHELLLNKILTLYQEHVNYPCGADEEGHLCPIHVAIQFNQLTCLSILLKYNADINKKETQHGLTPIMLAAVCDNIAAIQILLAYKPDLNLSNAYGRKLLFILAERGLTDILPQIINDYKIDVNQYLNEGSMNNTPLHVACMFNQPHMVHMLLELGANTSLLDAQGKTPLQLAEELNSISAKHVLLKSTASNKQKALKTNQLPASTASTESSSSLENEDILDQKNIKKAIKLNDFKYQIVDISSSNLIDENLTSTTTTSTSSNSPILKKKD